MKIKLLDVTEDIFAGGDVPKDRFSEVITDEYKIPVYANAEKDDGLYGYTDIARVSVPCVTVAARGTIGFTAKRKVPFLPVVRLITVIPNKEKITLNYLYYALRNCKPKSSGTSIPQLTVPNIKNYSFEIVPIPKQEEITQVLDKVELLIKMQKEQIEQLDTLIKFRFVEMFGTIHDNRYEYEIVTLQDVCEQIKDGTHQTPTYITDTNSGVKFMSSKDVTGGIIDWNHLKYITKELHEELYARISPQKGDILLAKNGTTGIAAVVDRDEVFDIYVSLALLRPIKMEPTYLWAAINSKETKEQFDANLKGIGVPNLHLKEIKTTKILLPPMDLQTQFTTFVEQVDKLKAMIQQSTDEMQTLFDRLMQKYFG